MARGFFIRRKVSRRRKVFLKGKRFFAATRSTHASDSGGSQHKQGKEHIQREQSSLTARQGLPLLLVQTLRAKKRTPNRRHDLPRLHRADHQDQYDHQVLYEKRKRPARVGRQKAVTLLPRWTSGTARSRSAIPDKTRPVAPADAGGHPSGKPDRAQKANGAWPAGAASSTRSGFPPARPSPAYAASRKRPAEERA